jgi:hypothetical protein
MDLLPAERRGTMHVALYAGQQKRIFSFIPGIFLLTLLFFLLTPSSVDAQSTGSSKAIPLIDVSQPMNTLYRDTSWMTVQATITNTPVPLSGFLVAQTCNYAGQGTYQLGSVSPWHYQIPIRLSANMQRTYSISLPFTMGNLEAQSVLVILTDAHGNVINETTVGRGYNVAPSDVLIGTLSDHASDLNTTLIRLALPNQKDTLTTVPLDATTFPTQSSLLSIYNVLILDSFSTSSLSQAQLLALRSWINQGGTLFEIGGDQWQRTLSPLPTDLLPVSLTGLQSLPGGTPLFPIMIPPSAYSLFVQLNKSPGKLTISSSTLRTSSAFGSNKTFLSYNSSPLIVQAHLGQGFICYLAFDPMQPSLLNWFAQPSLWETLLFSTLGAHFLIPTTATSQTAGPGDLLTHIGILRMISPEALSGLWIVFLLLLSFVLFLGPIRLLLLRYLQPAHIWRWHLFFAGILLFSLASYGFSSYQRPYEVSDNTVSLIRFNQDASSAHVITYHGIFSSSNAPLTLQFPGENLIQPPTNNLLNYANLNYSGEDSAFDLTTTPGNSSVQLANSSSWLLHPLVTESDAFFHGRPGTQLSLDHGYIVGTISNTLPGPVNDLYVLFTHSFARLGSLAPGESRSVHIPLTTLPNSSQTSLANAISQQGNLAAPYFPYDSNDTPHSDFEHHMALLSALNGSGTNFKQCANSCNEHAITDNGNLYFADTNLPNSAQMDLPDPLLIPGTSATLIGWMDQRSLPNSTVTMNNVQLPGLHENFFQMPLSFGLSSFDHLPSTLIRGQIVDIAGSDAKMVLPGIYTLSDGGLTFELPIPQPLHMLPASLTISIPNLLASPHGLDRLSNLTNLQALLYNWQTNHWDNIQLQQNTFSSHNATAYLGHDQYVLVHISNDANNLGQLFFGTPSLSFQ